jgi:hypothetical protein
MVPLSSLHHAQGEVMRKSDWVALQQSCCAVQPYIPVPAVDWLLQKVVVCAGMVRQHKMNSLQLQQQLARHVAQR